MPMSSAQLTALVERARQKPPPAVVSPPPPPPAPPHRSVRARQATPAPSTARPPSPALGESTPKQAPAEPPTHPTPATPPPHRRPEAAQPEAALDDFPTGWELRKESWHFHRRFFRVFRRPMERGEYSHLLWQVRRRKAEHLWEDCWRVTLPDGKRTLMVRATRWQLITILPKDWLPPKSVD